MRLLNIFAALSGLIALVALVYAAHALRDVPEAAGDFTTALERIKLGATIQLGAAAAGLAIANRDGRLNLIAGALILGGAAIFAGTLYAVSMLGARATMAPIGGITMLLGWLTLTFTKPGQ